MSKKTKNLILNILLCVFAVIFAVSSYFLYKEIMVYKEGTDEYSSWAKTAIFAEDGSVNDPLVRVVNFDELKKTNPDTVGWIYIPDTVIDYPVVQSSDNDKYLHTMFSGERNKAGTIFVDYRNTMNFTDDNTVIYGHNMKNKSMFHILSKYGSQEFYDEHKTAYFYTPDGTYELRIFAAYTVNANDPYTDISFGSSSEEIINKFIERSKITSAFTLGPNTKIASLSTCAYDYDDARFVVHAAVRRMYYGGN